MAIHEDHRKAMIEALAWGRVDLYQNNVHFYDAVHRLIPLIQILVDGLAERAIELGEIDERRLKRLMEGDMQ